MNAIQTLSSLHQLTYKVITVQSNLQWYCLSTINTATLSCSYFPYAASCSQSESVLRVKDDAWLSDDTENTYISFELYGATHLKCIFNLLF
jgi:hypothetical protein